jgi:hypothetical protein
MPEEKDKNKSRMNDILMAMTSPLEFTSLPLRGRWTATTPAGEKKRMAFDLVIPADAVPVDEPDQNHMNLEFEYAARDANGKVVASNGRTVEAHFKPETLAHIRSGGLTYQGALELPAGEYSVRFVVRDNLSGRLGSVSAPLTVP